MSRYEDIIDLPHHVSKKHSQMSILDRAAQFSPFAALTGYGDAIDVGVCVAFGVIGWLMNKYEFPLSPILLALILGPMCEQNFVRYMNIQHGNFFAIVKSPIAMVFAGVALLVIVYSIYNQHKINKREAAARAAGNAE